MYKHILVPTDGSELSQAAVSKGLALAKSVGAQVTALTVVLTYEAAPLWDIATSKNPEAYNERAATIAARHLRQAEEAAAAVDVPLESVTVNADFPWQAIIAAATDGNVDLIVMASHGAKGVTGLLLGSQTQKVLAHCTTPVLVHR